VVRADGQRQSSRSEVVGLLGQSQRICGPGVGGFDSGLGRVALQRVADVVLGAAGGASNVDRPAVAVLAQQQRPGRHPARRADRVPGVEVLRVGAVGEPMNAETFECVVKRPGEPGRVGRRGLCCSRWSWAAVIGRDLRSASVSAGALLVGRVDLLSEHLAQPRDWHEQPAPYLDRRKITVVGRCVGGCTAEAEDASGFLDCHRGLRAPIRLMSLRYRHCCTIVSRQGGLWQAMNSHDFL
jgi:hypothetical protein